MENLVKKFDYVLVDFDDTVYHTHGLVQDTEKIFLAHGVAMSDYKETMNQAAQGHDGHNFKYTFSYHVELLKARGYALPDSLVPLLERQLSVNHVHDDAEQFLQVARAIGQQVILLTGGDPDFQMNKISVSGLQPYFNEIVIVPSSQEKIEFLKKIKQENKRVLFVNDEVSQNNMVAELYDDVLVVGKKHPVRFDESKAGHVPYFDHLKDILTYVRDYCKI